MLFHFPVLIVTLLSLACSAQSTTIMLSPTTAMHSTPVQASTTVLTKPTTTAVIPSSTPSKHKSQTTSMVSPKPVTTTVTHKSTSSPHVSVTPTPSSTPVAPSSSMMPGPTQAGSKKFTFSFKIESLTCSNALKENIVMDSAYKTLSDQIISAVKAAFVADKTFKGAKVVRFECGSVIAVVEVTKSVNATGTADQELSPVKTQISNGTFAGYTTSTFNSNPSAAALPSLYIILKTTLSNKQLCANKEMFKMTFAKFLVTSNGEGYVQPSQIVFAVHKCNDPAAATTKASVNIYVSGSRSDASTPDTELTTRAAALIRQLIEDGTTWRLSAAFDRKISSANLGGSAKPKDDSLSELTRVGIGTAVTFAVLLIIIFIILIISCRRKPRQENSEAMTFQNQGYAMQQVNSFASVNDGYDGNVNETKITVGEHDYEYPLAPVNEKAPHTDTKDSYEELGSNNANGPNQPAYEPLTAAEEEGYLRVEVDPNLEQKRHSMSMDELSQRKDNDQEMRKEFESLEYNMPSSNVYPQQSLDKNRLTNIIPRPETRVILSSLSNQPGSDYINANFVKDQQQNKRYILTQSPLQSTAEDFWKMIDEQGIHVIVMVTPLVQLSVEKCYQYWPADSVAKQYGEIEVQLKKKELKPDFTITTMSVKSKGETREVMLYRYMTWPENNIPENAKTFVTFLLEAKNACESHDGKMMVVHCSDGVGISASFVAVDIGIQSLQEKRSVDIHSIVKGIRKDRAGAIQVFDQYKFIYRALHEYLVHHGGGLDAYANAADATSSM